VFSTLKRRGAIRTADVPPSSPVGSALAPLPSMLGDMISFIFGNGLASMFRATNGEGSRSTPSDEHGIVN
jgi:hypothetical protein